jgi:XTP/dITP diphosphohydrolase
LAKTKKGDGEKMSETLVIVTGNKGKANEIAIITGFTVEAKNIDIPEIQSLDIESVAREKALAAYEILKRPVVVDDTGMSIEALNGLPGALVAWFLDTLNPQGILDTI